MNVFWAYNCHIFVAKLLHPTTFIMYINSIRCKYALQFLSSLFGSQCSNGYACMLNGKQWITSSKTLIKYPNAFFLVKGDNVTHYVSGDLRFSFESDDGIPLKHKLRANEIPLYILRGLSRCWGLHVCERYGQK